MLKITKTVDGDKLILGLSGRLDTLTVSELEKVIAEEVSDDTNLFVELSFWAKLWADNAILYN